MGHKRVRAIPGHHDIVHPWVTGNVYRAYPRGIQWCSLNVTACPGTAFACCYGCLHLAQGVLMVFDVTNRDSFENVEHWLTDIQEVRVNSRHRAPRRSL